MRIAPFTPGCSQHTPDSISAPGHTLEVSMRVRLPRVVVTVAASAALFAAAPAVAAAPGLADPIPGRIPIGSMTVGLRTVASGFVSPNYATVAPGVGQRLFVVDQVGKIWNVDLSARRSGRRSLFADLSPLLVRLGDTVPGLRYDERGLLGLSARTTS